MKYICPKTYKKTKNKNLYVSGSINQFSIWHVQLLQVCFFLTIVIFHRYKTEELICHGNLVLFIHPFRMHKFTFTISVIIAKANIYHL